MNKEQRARLVGALAALAEGGPGQDLEAAVEVLETLKELLETLKELLETAVDLLNEAAAKDLP